ncbi:MAG: hypothetical protein OCD00_18905 [Colwellia sp.]
MFNLLEKNKINFITLEHVTTGEESKKIGKPLQNYQHWLGEVVYDQAYAGELLANTLISEHNLNTPNNSTYITGLGGAYDAVTQMRNNGLKQSILKNKSVHLNQIFTMNFDDNIVKQRFRNVAKRYPNTNIIWCASSQMAVEVVNQINGSDLFPNQKLIIGGFDFIPSALEMAKKEEITALVGGHFLMAVKAINQIIDNHHGINHINKKNNFELVTKENIEQYQDFINNKKWRLVDFSKFLLSNKSANNPQEINVQNLINQLNNTQQ